MDAGDPPQVTDLLRRMGWSSTADDQQAFVQLYDELRRLAGGIHRSGGTLQPTGLVHEAWFKLSKHLGTFRDREHFYAVAALAMRQVLTDHARAARAQRRSRPRVTLSLDRLGSDAPSDALDLIALDDALTKLARLNPRHAHVVELRFLAGLSIRETAAALGVGHATVETDWAMAQAWLRAELSRGDGP